MLLPSNVVKVEGAFSWQFVVVTAAGVVSLGLVYGFPIIQSKVLRVRFRVPSVQCCSFFYGGDCGPCFC